MRVGIGRSGSASIGSISDEGGILIPAISMAVFSVLVGILRFHTCFYARVWPPSSFSSSLVCLLPSSSTCPGFRSPGAAAGGQPGACSSPGGGQAVQGHVQRTAVAESERRGGSGVPHQGVRGRTR